MVMIPSLSGRQYLGLEGFCMFLLGLLRFSYGYFFAVLVFVSLK